MARYSPNMNVMMKAVEKASKHLVRDFGEVENLQISMKGPGDFVSAADKRSEQILQEELSYARPDFGFLMEEGGEIKGKDPSKRWIIDPLDGTANFINAIPHWCITMALEEEGQITAALTYDPLRDELFWAEKGIGAFMRHQRLRVSGKKEPKTAMIGVNDYLLNKSPEDYWQKMDTINHTFGKVKNFGSMGLDLAYVAAGRFDGHWAPAGHSAWDCAAGILLIRESGGYISDFANGADVLNSKEFIAGNPHIHEELRKIVK